MKTVLKPCELCYSPDDNSGLRADFDTAYIFLKSCRVESALEDLAGFRVSRGARRSMLVSPNLYQQLCTSARESAWDPDQT